MATVTISKSDYDLISRSFTRNALGDVRLSMIGHGLADILAERGLTDERGEPSEYVVDILLGRFDVTIAAA